MKRIVNFLFIYILSPVFFIGHPNGVTATTHFANSSQLENKAPDKKLRNRDKNTSFFSLNKKNPHYFLFRGEPTILITSAEHYGAVINLDFDYRVYLKELKKYDFNLTRLFIGNYVENVGWFKYPQDQPLSPASNRLIVPWERSREPGYINGGNKFDLSSYNPEYFKRLKDFIELAGKYDIIVEIVLFCPFYNDVLWEYSPWHQKNNINDIGNFKRDTALTLNNGKLLEVQTGLVDKIVSELRFYDNIYYEICNEPYVMGVPANWQNFIIEKIIEAESTYTNKHLVAVNIQNGTSQLSNPNPHVDIFNWHYAYPEERTLDDDIATLNYHLNKPIGNDETGMTTDPNFYRMEGWETILAGCAVFNNLDLSFLSTDEKGKTAPKAVNSGGPVLREWLKILKNFISDFEFIQMKPQNNVIETASIPKDVRARVLAETGKQYAIYFRGGEGKINPQIKLPEGKYRIKWLNTKTGKFYSKQKIVHPGGTLTIESPVYLKDIALSITSK
ncbi:hypothetical protein [Maribellus maritimus]|uniref:hypothetical protein n=1 Tax=Maribellus maritimus TaxID=2870838 RepID=UPI001EEC5AE6|nr:hypothetical protein [Maribellus maritimus]MCG6187313.1 hypothetical protein [Maribellus maritimus]